jgi:hypothetical protein
MLSDRPLLSAGEIGAEGADVYPAVIEDGATMACSAPMLSTTSPSLGGR